MSHAAQNLGSTLVNQADYTYTSASFRSSLTTTSGTTNYTYDPAGQLTSATYPAGSGLLPDNYSYDPAGNRTSATGSPLGSFTYDSADRLLSDTTNTYTYDKEGDLLTRTAKASGATTTYTWSAEHQLTGITFPDGSKATYKYDPLGRRVEIDEGMTVTRYAYDQQNIAAEYDGTNTLTASYVYDPTSADEPLEMTRGGQRYFYLADALHSTTALTTLSGGVAATYSYSAFGIPTENASLANAYTYTGQLYDPAAGLVLFPARAYDPALGRFLSEDPAFSINPYPYVSNDPINGRDPTGKDGSEYTIINNRIAGKAAEVSVGVFEVMQYRVAAITGSAIYRIIDAIEEAGGLVEFKDVAYQALTSQLTDFILNAQAVGVPFYLLTRGDTWFSEPLWQLINDGTVLWLPVL